MLNLFPFVELQCLLLVLHSLPVLFSFFWCIPSQASSLLCNTNNVKALSEFEHISLSSFSALHSIVNLDFLCVSTCGSKRSQEQTNSSGTFLALHWHSRWEMLVFVESTAKILGNPAGSLPLHFSPAKKRRNRMCWSDIWCVLFPMVNVCVSHWLTHVLSLHFLLHILSPFTCQLPDQFVTLMHHKALKVLFSNPILINLKAFFFLLLWHTKNFPLKCGFLQILS